MISHIAVSTFRRRPVAGTTLIAAAIALAACADDATTPTHPLLPAVSLSPNSNPSFGKGAPHGASPIVFSSNRDGNYEIYKMNPDGSGQTRLTFDRSSDHQAVLSPDGTKIAFRSTRQNGLGDIYTMNVDGSGLKRITTTVGASQSPTWSPDGSKIAFASTRDAVDPLAVSTASAYEIYTMNADGSNVVRITNNNFNDIYPAWSADGKHIAFSSDRDHVNTNIRDLYMMDVNGANVTRLTNQDGYILWAGWDGKSRRITYTALGAAAAPGIYVLDLTTMVSTRLTFGAADEDLDSSFSPDGTQLAYAHYVAGVADIYVMNVDGSGKTKITTNPANDSWARWSR